MESNESPQKDEHGGNNENDNDDEYEYEEDDPFFPLLASLPINGRITTLLSFSHPSSPTDYIFFTTETKQYAIVSYNSNSNGGGSSSSSGNTSNNNKAAAAHRYKIQTHASGDLSNPGVPLRGRDPETGPKAILEPHSTCIALHLYEGFVTILPLSPHYSTTVGGVVPLVQPLFQARLEESNVFDFVFLQPSTRATELYYPQLSILYQNARGQQHVITHSVDLAHKTLVYATATSSSDTTTTTKPGAKRAAGGASTSAKLIAPPMKERLVQPRVDGSCGMIVPVPPLDRPSPAPVLLAQDSKLPASGTTSAAVASPVAAAAFGGILIVGQTCLTYHCTASQTTHYLPIPQAIYLSWTMVQTTPNSSGGAEDDPTVRFLLGSEVGELQLLMVQRTREGVVTGLHLETLGITSVSSCLVHLDTDWIMVGSQFGDSQLVEILKEPIVVNGGGANRNTMSSSSNSVSEETASNMGSATTFVRVVEEYSNLGPIVDFDLVPTSHSDTGMEQGTHSPTTTSAAAASLTQSMVVTASGAGKDGSLRLVRNGIGMTQHAAVELGGIKGMWSVRKMAWDVDDAFLIQSYVGETRILGVSVENEEEKEDVSLDEEMSEEGGDGSLEEVEIAGLDSARSTLYAGNVALNSNKNSTLMIQITQVEIRLLDLSSRECIHTWNPSSLGEHGSITIASANEAGQIMVSLRGGVLLYLHIVAADSGFAIQFSSRKELDREISCIDLNPMNDLESESEVISQDVDMVDVGQEQGKRLISSSKVAAIGLWDDSSVRLLSLDNSLVDLLYVQIDQEGASSSSSASISKESSRISQQMMPRSLCLTTLDSYSASASHTGGVTRRVNMLLIGLGDGGLVSFVLETKGQVVSAHSRKEVSLGTRSINLVPFYDQISGKGACVLATGDRPTAIYLTGGAGGSNTNPKLCYSNIHLSTDNTAYEEESPSNGGYEHLIVNVATPFQNSFLFHVPTTSERNYSLCVSDESSLRLGMIDDIQKLHITTHKLGMAPRRVTYHKSGRIVCVGCIDDGIQGASKIGGETNMGNCVRFFDDTSFEEIDRLDLDPYEMILSLISTELKIVNETSIEGDATMESRIDNRGDDSDHKSDETRPFIIIGTGFNFPDEDEPSRGRILVIQCSASGRTEPSSLSSAAEGVSSLSRKAIQVAETQVTGGVFSICPFYGGTILSTINSKTRLFKLVNDDPGIRDVFNLEVVGKGHHGHILSLFVKSLVSPTNANVSPLEEKSRIAIVGDMMRSISVVQHFPDFNTLEEVARDYNQNWTTAIEMLSDDVYLGAEHFQNLFVLRRNTKSSSVEVRTRLDTVGVFHIGELVNKFKNGSLVMPSSHSSTESIVLGDESQIDSTAGENISAQIRRPTVNVCDQTLFGTVDGTIGSVIGLDIRTATFFAALERAISRIVDPIGNLKHFEFRSFRGEKRKQPSRGFIDGDLVETFMDLDRDTMEEVVKEMNKEGRWEVDEFLAVDDNESMRDETLEPTLDRDLIVNDVLAMVEEISLLH